MRYTTYDMRYDTGQVCPKRERRASSEAPTTCTDLRQIKLQVEAKTCILNRHIQYSVLTRGGEMTYAVPTHHPSPESRLSPINFTTTSIRQNQTSKPFKTQTHVSQPDTLAHITPFYPHSHIYT